MKAEILGSECYDQWNYFVDQSPQGNVFCYSWWLNAATQSNFKIYVIRADNKIVAGMPLAYDEQNRINLPHLTRILGILYINREYSTEQKRASTERKWLMELISYIPADNFVQTCMHFTFQDWLPYSWVGLRQTTRYTYVINLEHKSRADLWNNLDSLRKRTIRNAVKNNIKVELCDDFDLVYRFASMAYNRQGLRFVIPYEKLLFLDDAIRTHGNRIILKASDDSRTHAVLYAAYDKRSAYYLLSGSDPSLRKLGGHTLIMWDAIRFFLEKAELFNFCGSDIESIEKHFRGFGGVQTPYFHIYNENQMWAKNNFHYHLRSILYHLKCAAKIASDKFN